MGMDKKIASILILILLFCCVSVYAKNESRTFRDVKKQAKIIWQDHRVSFYCSCPYDTQLRVDHSACGYKPQDMKRANRIEWEHLVPVSWFSQQRPCWKQTMCKTQKGKAYSGRNCCEKVDAEFRLMYTDLHNLVPAVGEVNKARQYFRFVASTDDAVVRNYNGCNIQINELQKKVVPADSVKGMIARAHLYMQKTYDFKLSRQQNKLFLYWHKQYPPTEWERIWNQRVMAIQGTDNSYISQYDFSH
tara:strand:- start:21134 stop:21874 length:741 start_codon:yes stop_codon:yes gene_type:complete